MTERKQAIEQCLLFADVYEDYPFDDNWTAMRHKDNKKTFAFIYRYKNQMRINLKVRLETGFYLRQRYQSVTEAYHMNKLHWVTVVLDDSVPDSEIATWLKDSYELTATKKLQTKDLR